MAEGGRILPSQVVSGEEYPLDARPDQIDTIARMLWPLMATVGQLKTVYPFIRRHHLSELGNRRNLLAVAGDCDIVPLGLPGIVVDRQGARGNLIRALARHLAQYLPARLEVLLEAHCDRYSRTRWQPVFEPRHPNHANSGQRGEQYCCAIESDAHQDTNGRR